jgi:replication-associated recombination protein RarA
LDRQLRTLAERQIGTLVIAEADQFNRQQQDQLHRWVTQHPLTQVIATASEPLFPLVVRNVLSAPLFFQLNPTSLLIEAVLSELV